MKNSRRFTVVVSILLVLTLCFIWGNSLVSRSDSKEASTEVGGFITPFLELFLGKGNVTDHIVRKLAHFTEFAVLGCELTLLLCRPRRRPPLQWIINALAAALACAVTDEALQLLSDRGSQVQDVLLDFCGAAAGIAATLAVCAVLRCFWNRQR